MNQEDAFELWEQFDFVSEQIWNEKQKLNPDLNLLEELRATRKVLDILLKGVLIS